MIKNILFSTLFLMSFSAFTQIKLIEPLRPNIDLNNTTINISGTPADANLNFALSVINTSSQTYTIKCRRTEVDVQSNTKNVTCWEQCSPDLDEGDFTVFVVGQSGIQFSEIIAAGDTVVGFSANHKPSNEDGCSLYLYEFFDDADPSVTLANVFGRFSHNVNTSCTASQLENKKLELSIFPNPVQNELTIHLDRNNLNLSIVDLLGNIVLSKKNTAKKNTVYLSNLTNGVYFVVVKEDEVVIKTEKLIIKN